MKNKPTTKSFAIQRPWEPGTAAIVSFTLESEQDFSRRNALKANPYLSDEMQAQFLASAAVGRFKVAFLRDLLITALTAWAKNSAEGAEAFRGSSQDFNIGDLSNADASNEPFLAECGILSLEIETASAEDGDWEYDRVLIDSDELESEPA